MTTGDLFLVWMIISGWEWIGLTRKIAGQDDSISNITDYFDKTNGTSSTMRGINSITTYSGTRVNARSER